MASGRTVKLKSLNWMEIYYMYIAMASEYKTGLLYN